MLPLLGASGSSAFRKGKHTAGKGSNTADEDNMYFFTALATSFDY